jgi:pilus assembly protein CpaF
MDKNHVLDFLQRNIQYEEVEDNIIDNLLSMEEVSEIMVNNHEEIFYEKNGRLFKLNQGFNRKESYLSYIRKLLMESNKVINENNPILDFELNTLRINLIKESLSNSQPILTIRKKTLKNVSLYDLVKNGFMNREMYTLIEKAIKNKKNIFIAGGTSTGKTTLLNAIVNEISKEERLVIIEDTREIQALKNSNTVYLTARKAIYDLKEISLKELIKTSLRLRPDRIILGEIRREEVIDFLHVINSGHDGSICTGHASSAMDMILRLKLMLYESGIDERAAQIMLFRGIDYVIYLEKEDVRKITQIFELEYENDQGYFKKVF